MPDDQSDKAQLSVRFDDVSTIEQMVNALNVVNDAYGACLELVLVDSQDDPNRHSPVISIRSGSLIVELAGLLSPGAYAGSAILVMRYLLGKGKVEDLARLPLRIVNVIKEERKRNYEQSVITARAKEDYVAFKKFARARKNIEKLEEMNPSVTVEVRRERDDAASNSEELYKTPDGGEVAAIRRRPLDDRPSVAKMKAALADVSDAVGRVCSGLLVSRDGVGNILDYFVSVIGYDEDAAREFRVANGLLEEAFRLLNSANGRVEIISNGL